MVHDGLNRNAHQYLHCMVDQARTNPNKTYGPSLTKQFAETVDSIAALACVMLQRRTRTKSIQNVERVRSVISRRYIQW